MTPWVVIAASAFMLPVAVIVALISGFRESRPDDGVCPLCGYPLAGLRPSATCPECGAHAASRDEAHARQAAWRPGLAVGPSVAAALIFVGSLTVPAWQIGQADTLLYLIAAASWPPFLVALVLSCLFWSRPASKLIVTITTCMTIAAACAGLLWIKIAPRGARPDITVVVLSPILGFIALGPGLFLGSLIPFGLGIPWPRERDRRESAQAGEP